MVRFCSISFITFVSKCNLIPNDSVLKISKDNAIPYTKDRYLSNIQNKSEFIKFISNLLIESNVEVHNCSGDADSFIVAKSLEHALVKVGHPVNVIADDTDIAIMLLHHWKPDDHEDVYFVQERFDKAWSIKEANLCKSFSQKLIIPNW